jgi:hypothetical protein
LYLFRYKLIGIAALDLLGSGTYTNVKNQTQKPLLYFLDTN